MNENKKNNFDEITTINTTNLIFLLQFGISRKEELINFLDEFSKLNYHDFIFLRKFDEKEGNRREKLKYKRISSKYPNKVIESIEFCKDNNLETSLEDLFVYQKQLCYKHFFEVIEKNSKKEILEKLYKLLELRIFKINADYPTNLDGIYTGRISGPKHDYDIKWIYSDGKREYLAPYSDSNYQFKLTDAKYIISREDCKFSTIFNEKKAYKIPVVDMTISDWNFDINSLPTKEELYSIEKKPISESEEKKIIATINAVNNIYNVEKSAEDLRKDLEEIRNILKEIPPIKEDPIIVSSILSSLSNVEEISEYIIKLKDQLIEEYANSIEVKEDTLYKTLVRKRKYEQKKNDGVTS